MEDTKQHRRPWKPAITHPQNCRSSVALRLQHGPGGRDVRQHARGREKTKRVWVINKKPANDWLQSEGVVWRSDAVNHTVMAFLQRRRLSIVVGTLS